ncbi:MAG: 2-oxo acid dehydrogenase subunit E2 [Woeseiaceae bacterium]|nr:2-oxo acid dehydrogenase subunit E2 [Woeseiaceae bacterium]
MSDSINAIIMPKLGLSMTEGSVVEWRVETGGEIAPGDVIADIETSKIVNELEVHVGGTLRKTVVELGVDVPVGALIAVVSDADVSDADIDGFVSSYIAGDGEIAESVGTAEEQSPDDVAVKPAPATDSPTESIPGSLQGDYDPHAVFASHHAHKMARRLGINLAAVSGTGRQSRISRKDVENAVRQAGGSLSGARDSVTPPASVRTTPVAKRLADKHDIDLTDVAPTGSRGRITKGDVLRHLEQASAVSPRVPASPALSSTSNPYEEETLSSARKVIASRLSESKTMAPHYRLSLDVIIDKLLELRGDIQQGDSETRVTVNDMLVRAAALALAKHPEVNIQFDGKVIRRFTHADIAVAVALDDGLVTPIVRNADQKGLIEIAGEVSGLVKRAQTGKLLPDEFQGGTFTLSNLGMFGIKSFDAIINPPQAAIMAIGRAERRLYVGEEDAGRVATFMTVTMSCDHRVIDGATGAQFLQTFKNILHHPGRLLLQP